MTGSARPSPTSGPPSTGAGSVEGPGAAGRGGAPWASLVGRAGLFTVVLLLLSFGGLFAGADRVGFDAFRRAEDLRAWKAGTAGSDRVLIDGLTEPEQLAIRSGAMGARAQLARRIAAWRARGAEAIVVNVELTTPGAGDDTLAAACRASGRVVLLSLLETPRPSQYGLTLPVPGLRMAASGYGFTAWAPDSDGVVRRFVGALPGGFDLSLPLAVYGVVQDLPPGAIQSHIRFDHQVIEPGDIDRSYQLRLAFAGPPGQAFQTIAPGTPNDALPDATGKVVVIGQTSTGATAMVTPLAESWRRPLADRWPEPTSDSELVATAIDTVLRQRVIHPVVWSWFGLGLFALAFAASLAADRLRSRPAAAICLALGLAWLVASWLSFGARHELPVGEGWATLLCGLIYGIYYRLRRDVQRHQQQAWVAESERRRLADLDAAKRAVVGMVVHDLKVPVTIIKGQALTLASDPQQELGEALHQEFLGTIVGQCDRLDAMIEDLLDIDPERKVTLHYESTDLATLIERAMVIHDATSPRHSFRLLAEAVPAVDVDPGKLTRVMNNLLSNAVKYSPDGGEVRVELAPEGADFVRIAVTDPGIGMTPEQVERLFGLFVRVLDQPESIPGTGVGLYSVRQLIEHHGGRVEVSSVVGEGSTFTLHLPIHRPDAPPAVGAA